MALITCLLLVTQIMFTISEPIDDGTDVGTIKIYKGKRIVLNPGKFPYIVHLDTVTEKIEHRKIIETHGYCGGTLIRPDVVLTAAHCIGDTKKNPKITAWLGIVETDLQEGLGQEIPVKGFTIHDGYIDSAMLLQNINDIALLWLLHPAREDGLHVKVAKLPAEDFSVINKPGWIIGWGTGSCGKKHTMLQKAVVRGVSPSECQKYYQRTLIPSTLICIMSDDKKKTSTSGDSGGPFIVQDTVVGVSSFGAIDWENTDEQKGRYACDAKKPAAYTYVPKYLDWIENCLKEGPETLIIKPPPTRVTLKPSRRIPPPVPPRRESLRNRW